MVSVVFDEDQSSSEYLETLDITGKVIQGERTSGKGDSMHLKVNQKGTLDSGLYLVRLSIDDRTFTSKLMINPWWREVKRRLIWESCEFQVHNIYFCDPWSRKSTSGSWPKGLYGNVAGVVKLVDTLDLGSSASRLGGSSPSTRTYVLRDENTVLIEPFHDNEGSTDTNPPTEKGKSRGWNVLFKISRT